STDKWDALSAADVFALPSDYDSFGIVVLEALLSGTPAVMSDGVYLAEELEGTGVSVCRRDPGSLAHEIGTLLGDRSAARRRALQAQAVVKRRFAPDA